MAPHLHLSTLGAPLLFTLAGEQVKFRTRKHFALLIRLGVESGRRFTRDHLTDLLWPDAPARHARHSLAQALSVLKAKVGREHLLLQKATVALAEGVVDVDACRLGDGHADVRGPFLDGFEIPGAPSFEQWKDEWSAKLTPRIRDCLVAQMDAGRRIGDFAAVERHAQLLYELDALSEDAVRGLMEARAWAGDRMNALKIYARFAVRLEEELGAKPSADLVRMASLLREGRASVPRQRDGDGTGTVRHERRFEAETLIGREKEFAVLYDNWLEVRQRRPRVVVVTGDPGIGKTTLANAFVSTCQMEGAVVARAQAYDAERELPFAVLAELVRQLALQRAIGSADPDALSELARIAPAVFDAFPGVPKPVEWAAEVTPLRLADAFLRTITAAGDESPVILVVDDIHAADNASAAILHLVARKLEGTRLLLLLAGRSGEFWPATAPGDLVSDSSVETMQALELQPLSPDALERLVASIASKAGGIIQELPTRRILRAANGNPLALELLTKEWLAHGSTSLLADLEALNTRPVATIGIPRVIGAVFERQIRRLHTSARAALDLAAVLGRRLADLPLYDIVGLSPAAAGETLSRLREEGFLREIHGGLEFRNELIRAQAYYAVAGPARQHLHRRVAELLSERPSEDRQPLHLEIAWHFLRGGDGGRAMGYGLAGAEEAMRAGAPYEAQRILEALIHDPEVETCAPRIHILAGKALLDQSKAEAALATLAGLAGTTGLSPSEAAEVARMRATARYLINEGTAESYVEAAEAALIAAREVGDPEILARALFECARAGAEGGDEGRVLAAQAQIHSLQATPAAGVLPVLHYAQAFCSSFFFEPARAAESMEIALKLLTPDGSPGELSFAYNGYGNCRLQLCEFAAACEAYGRGFELARKIGDDSRASVVAGNLCGVLSMMGDYRRAVDVGQEGVRFGIRVPNQPVLITCFTSLAEAHALAGDKDRALECLKDAQDWLQERQSWSANVEFLCQKALVALLMGDLGLALNTTAVAEKTAWRRERTVPNPGVLAKLRILRAAHVFGPEHAWVIANDALAKFCGRHPLHSLAVWAAVAWLENETGEGPTAKTQRALAALETPEMEGYRAMLVAQGFLPQNPGPPSKRRDGALA